MAYQIGEKVSFMRSNGISTNAFVTIKDGDLYRLTYLDEYGNEKGISLIF